jgi:hypothetical protein
MRNSIKIAPPNSLLFVSDQRGGDTPDIVRRKSIWSTPSCIAIGCLMFADGPTAVTLGRSREVAPKGQPAFDGNLPTPSGVVSITLVGGREVLHEAVLAKSTRVRVWTNRTNEPDEVIVGLE